MKRRDFLKTAAAAPAIVAFPAFAERESPQEYLDRLILQLSFERNFVEVGRFENVETISYAVGCSQPYPLADFMVRTIRLKTQDDVATYFRVRPVIKQTFEGHWAATARIFHAKGGVKEFDGQS